MCRIAEPVCNNGADAPAVCSRTTDEDVEADVATIEAEVEPLEAGLGDVIELEPDRPLDCS